MEIPNEEEDQKVAENALVEVTSHYNENDDVDDDEDEPNGEMCLDISIRQDSEDFNGCFDDTLLEMTQSSTEPTPSKPVARKAQRTKNFMVNEDILLCKAWLNISMDVGHDNEQKRKTYWSRIYDYFHQNKNFESDRSVKSLTTRWGTINQAVGRFTGCYSQIQHGKQSNKTELDKINAAKELYYSLYQGFFKFEYCWNVLKDQLKWDVHTTEKKKLKTCKDSSPGGSSQPTSTSINPDEDGSQTQTSAATETPNFRRAEKERPRRGKNKATEEDLPSRKSLNKMVQINQPSHRDHDWSIQFEKDQEEREKERRREEQEKERQQEEREKERQQEAREKEWREEQEKEREREKEQREEQEKERQREEREKERQREEREREDQIREEEIMKLDLRSMTPHQVKYWTKKQLDILQKHNLM